MKRAVLLWVLIACTPAKSPSERCRNQAIIDQTTRNIGGRPNPIADAIENTRCDALERDERHEAHEESQLSAEEQARTEAMYREIDAKLLAVREHPNVPEVGGTIVEARTICERERGTFSQRNIVLTCEVGQPIVFSCLLQNDRITQVESFYENGTLPEWKARLAATLGPPQREFVSSEGFRVFLWEEETVRLTMYAKGVRLTRTK